MVYTGRLYGGPDDGNMVSSSQAYIPVDTTVELWLDGKGPNKSVSIVEIRGAYVWQPYDKLFIWEEDSNQVFTKKLEAA